jgi:DNA gyrase subunit A
MPLRRLAALERKKIEDEYKETIAAIKELEGLLKSPKRMRQVIGEELRLVKEDFGDRRRTHIVELKEGQPQVSLLTTTDLVPEKNIWVAVTADGLIARTIYDKQPRLSGKEAPAWLVHAATRDTLYLIDEMGEAAALPVHSLPEAETPLDGVPISKVSMLRGEGQKLAALFSLPPRFGQGEDSSELEKWCILTVTRQGMLKKSPLTELPGASASTFTLVKVNPGDQLTWLGITNGKNEILLVTAMGMAIRFDEEEVRPMGLVAAGVMGIKLQQNDEVAGADLLPQQGEIFIVTAHAAAKRVPIDQFPRQGRYGQGVQAWKIGDNDQVVGITIGKGTTKAILHLNKLLPKTIRLDEAPLQTRQARGQSIQELKAGDQVLRLTTAWEPPRPGAKPDQNRPKQAAETSSTKRNSGRAAPKSTASNTGSKKNAPAKPTTKTAPPKAAAEKPASKAGAKVSAAKPVASKPAAGSATKPAAEKTAGGKTAAKAAPKAAATKSTEKKAPAPTSSKKCPSQASSEKISC